MATASFQVATHSLDSLSRLSMAELDQLFRQATLPMSLQALNGRHQGRILAMQHLDRPPFSFLLRQFAGSRIFPWDGKNFSSESGWQGEGINRLRIGTQVKAFRFLTSQDSSALDGGPCIKIDYARAGNPWPVRKLRDELRELEPGLFIGPGLWQTRRQARLLLFFAVDARA